MAFNGDGDIMDNRQRDRVLVVLVIILIGVNLVLFVNGINLDCGKCEIKFTNNRVSGVEANFPAIEVKVQELYEGFKDGECRIKWERTRGYYE